MLPKYRIAIALPAVVLGLSMPAWAENADEQGKTSAYPESSSENKSPSVHPPTKQMNEAVAPQGTPSGDFKPEVSESPSDSSTFASGESKQAHPNPTTHPPTTTMDKAMSPQKSGDQPKAESEPTTIGPSGDKVE